VVVVGEIKPGKSYRVCFNHTIHSLKMHIVAIVENQMVVYKWYGKHKQYWRYNVEHIDMIKFYIKRYERKKDGTTKRS
jgi:hypothetical protein